MAITYNAGTNTITVTGYTEGTPCNFTDIYNADVAGGWGVVTRQCTKQFCLDCYLHIGDGSTASWFADELVQIILKCAVSPNFWGQIKSLANAHFRLGKLVDVSDKTTSNGCIVECLSPSTYPCMFGYSSGYGHNIELYDCIIKMKLGTYPQIFRNTHDLKIYNSTLQGYMSVIHDTELYKVRFHQSGYADGNIEKATGTLTMEDIEVTDGGCFYGSTAASIADATVKNGLIRNSDYIGDFKTNAYNNYFINIDADVWAFDFTSYTGKAYRQYEFDLKVIDKNNTAINGATVKIWDKDSNLIVDTTTNASGVIATQTITRGYYNQANGNTLQEASPHTIQIKKSGTNYLTYETDFTLDNKKEWVIMMVDVSDIITKLDSIQTDLDNPDQYKADVSAIIADLDNPDQYKADVSAIIADLDNPDQYKSLPMKLFPFVV